MIPFIVISGNILGKFVRHVDAICVYDNPSRPDRAQKQVVNLEGCRDLKILQSL